MKQPERIEARLAAAVGERSKGELVRTHPDLPLVPGLPHPVAGSSPG